MKKEKTIKSEASKITGVVELFKIIWSEYSANWKKFATILIIPLVLSFAINLGLVLIDVFATGLAWYWWVVIAILTALLLLIFFALYFIAYVAQFLLLKDLSQLVTFANLKEWYFKVKPWFWKFLAVSVIFGLFSLAGFVLLIIPGVIFMVYYCFAIYFVIFENSKIEGSFGLSRELVKGYWWAVFGRFFAGLFVVYVFYLVVGGVVTLATWLLSHFGGIVIDQNSSNLLYSALSIFIGLVVGPLTVLYTFNIYKSLKAIKQ